MTRIKQIKLTLHYNYWLNLMSSNSTAFVTTKINKTMNARLSKHK